MTRIILLRHGETDHNAKGMYCGSSDASLNKKGVGQARLLKKRLKGEHVDVIYTSDLRRALETCRRVFGGTKVKVIKKKGLREIDLGEWEGLTSEEIGRRHGRLYRKWIQDPSASKIPSGESLGQFRKRVLGALREILKREGGKTVAVVSHSGPCRVILLHALGAGMGSFWSISQDSCCVNIIEFHDRHNLVRVINDTSHLTKRSR
jgi:broad specificity phosphatase PhoE